MFGGDLEPQPSGFLENNGGSCQEMSEPSTSSNVVGSDLDLKSSDALANESEVNLQNFDSLAKGISSMLGNVIRDFDCSAENAVKSQDQLSNSLDRLTRELDQLLEDAPLPFIMQQAAKISGIRKRVTSLNSLLKLLQRRIDNIDRMLSLGLPHEKATSENAGQH